MKLVTGPGAQVHVGRTSKRDTRTQGSRKTKAEYAGSAEKKRSRWTSHAESVVNVGQACVNVRQVHNRARKFVALHVSHAEITMNATSAHVDCGMRAEKGIRLYGNDTQGHACARVGARAWRYR